MLFIYCPSIPNFKYLQTNEECVSSGTLKELIQQKLGTDDFSLYHNGFQIERNQFVQNGSTIQVLFGLPGGKGGFGSMLRAIGAQIEKTTNREACRDLSGRRLRDINEEQRLKRWIAKEAEREADKIRRRKERIERLKSKPRHNFVDFEYEKERSELPERIDEALSQGLEKAKSSKRKSPSEPGCSSKKPRSCLEMDDLSSSSDSDINELQAPDQHKSIDYENDENWAAYISKKQDSSEESENNDSFLVENSISDQDHTNEDGSKSTNEESNQTIDSSGNEKKGVSLSTRVKQKSLDNDFNHSTSTRDGMADSFVPPTKIKIGIIELDANHSSGTRDGMADSDGKPSVSMEPENVDSKVSLSTSNKDGKVDSEASSATSRYDTTEKNSDNAKSIDTENKSSGISSTNSQNLLSPSNEDQEYQNNLPIELMEFVCREELEALGLERLKNALMSRGLKCGGTLTDRAQRLWKVRGLVSRQYPAGLLAKKKNS